jgi:U32 family peptidase
VTGCYREAVNSILDGTWSEERVANWKERLATVFNRGFWDGYYLGQKTGEWSNAYGSRATRKKVYAGKAMNYYPKIGVAEFYIENGPLREGMKY